ncbi:MAG TPA: transcriptional coactivator p15/PC4 family protein [Syntrophorhabdaceae bacterium]|nr:transcriptional coactivator p15/PC4 family protein [Syntrophorhabdaceae bacterium]
MIIKEIRKKSKEVIRASVTQYRERMFCSIRIYFENDNGEWLPTKKGITFGLHLIDQVVEALNAAKEIPDG